MNRKLIVFVAALAVAASTACVAAAASSPAIVAISVTNITSTTASLHATVNPNGSHTSYYFEWGISTAYGSRSTSHSAGAGTTPVKVGTTLSKLTPGTLYHYHVVASNRFGVSASNDHTFRTTGHPPAVVVTGAPSVVGHSFVTLTGGVDPEGEATNWAFQYGVTTAYGSSSFGGSLPAATVIDQVQETLSGLASGTTFHYRLVAVHSGGVISYGADQVFITHPLSPPQPVVHALTTPRRSTSKPYLFTTTGSIVPPSEFPPAWSCNGVVAVRYFIGHKTRALAVTSIDSSCKFSARVLFHGLINHKSTRLRIEMRFRGNSYLDSAMGPVQRVRLG